MRSSSSSVRFCGVRTCQPRTSRRKWSQVVAEAHQRGQGGLSTVRRPDVQARRHPKLVPALHRPQMLDGVPSRLSVNLRVVVGAQQDEVVGAVANVRGQRRESRPARRPRDDVRFLAHERAGQPTLVRANEFGATLGAAVTRLAPQPLPALAGCSHIRMVARDTDAVRARIPVLSEELRRWLRPGSCSSSRSSVGTIELGLRPLAAM